MWRYEKRLQYPVNITTPNPKLATFIMSQYGGPKCINLWECLENLVFTRDPGHFIYLVIY